MNCIRIIPWLDDSVDIKAWWVGCQLHDVHFTRCLKINGGSSVDCEVHWETSTSWDDDTAVHEHRALAKGIVIVLGEFHQHIDEVEALFRDHRVESLEVHVAKFVTKDAHVEGTS